MTFKDTEGTDYVVDQVWMRRGADAYLLDQVRGRTSFVEACKQFRMLSARWPQAVIKLVDDKANGPAVISSLGRHRARHRARGVARVDRGPRIGGIAAAGGRQCVAARAGARPLGG